MNIKNIMLVGAIALAGLTAGAQTNPPAPVATTTSPSVTAGLQQVYDALKGVPLMNLTNYSIDPYATYAPKAPTKVGGGLLALYNVNDYVGAGLGVDWLGQFSLVSGNATLKLPTHPLVWTGWAWATNLAMTPFVIGGVGTPLGGASGNVSTIEDAGDAFEFGHLWGGRLEVGACYGQWTGAGAYSGTRYHAFLGWTKNF